MKDGLVLLKLITGLPNEVLNHLETKHVMRVHQSYSIWVEGYTMNGCYHNFKCIGIPAVLATQLPFSGQYSNHLMIEFLNKHNIKPTKLKWFTGQLVDLFKTFGFTNNDIHLVFKYRSPQQIRKDITNWLKGESL